MSARISVCMYIYIYIHLSMHDMRCGRPYLAKGRLSSGGGSGLLPSALPGLGPKLGSGGSPSKPELGFLERPLKFLQRLI